MAEHGHYFGEPVSKRKASRLSSRSKHTADRPRLDRAAADEAGSRLPLMPPPPSTAQTVPTATATRGARGPTWGPCTPCSATVRYVPHARRAATAAASCRCAVASARRWHAGHVPTCAVWAQAGAPCGAPVVALARLRASLRCRAVSNTCPCIGSVAHLPDKSCVRTQRYVAKRRWRSLVRAPDPSGVVPMFAASSYRAAANDRTESPDARVRSLGRSLVGPILAPPSLAWRIRRI